MNPVSPLSKKRIRSAPNLTNVKSTYNSGRDIIIHGTPRNNLRRTESATELCDPRTAGRSIGERETRQRIEEWLDSIEKAGSPPWNGEGGAFVEVNVGWFPEEVDFGYDEFEKGEEQEDVRWQLW